MRHTYCIFSDESGVFDNKNYQYFVFGGLILNTKKDDMKELSARYADIEKNLKRKDIYKDLDELKAAYLSPHDRRLLFSTMRDFQKFGVVITLDKVFCKLFAEKKTKQRYQDYAYKIGIRKAFEVMIAEGKVSKDDEIRFNFIIDEHHTATNGKYELEEGLLQEFKEGSYDQTFSEYYPPLFPNTKSLSLSLADTKHKIIVRAADIIANRIYFEARNDALHKIESSNMIIINMP